MRSFFLFQIGLIVLLFGSCDTNLPDIHICAVNLGTRAVDIVIGERPAPFFNVDNLPPGEVSPLVTAGGSGFVSVAFRYSDTGAWQHMPLELGDGKFSLVGGMFACLVVDTRGFLRVIDLGDDSASGARVAILNGCSRKLEAVELWPQRGGFAPALCARDVPQGGGTKFFSIVPGEYRLQLRDSILSDGETTSVFGGTDGAGMRVYRDATYTLVVIACEKGLPFIRQIPVAFRDQKNVLRSFRHETSEEK